MRRSRLRGLSILLLPLPALLSLSCAQRGGSLALVADAELMPRLGALVAARPLPQGWMVVEAAETSSGAGGERPAPPLATLSLAWERVGAAPSPVARSVDRRYMAAAVELSDERYSLGAAEAKDLGLVPLESILPPRRALSIEGLWPGKAAYPFTESLDLVFHPARSEKLPRDMTAWLDEAAASAAAEAEEPLELAAAGDIQVGERQWPLLAGGEAGLASLMGAPLLGLLRSSDLALANLEAPVTVRGYANPLKRFQFRMPPGSAASLKRAGFGLLLFANNHGFDFGSEGFEDSLLDFKAAGMPMVGAGENEAEAAAPLLLTRRGQRLAFVGLAFYPKERLGFSLGDAAAGEGRAGTAVDEAAALAAVKSAAESGATVVVLAHGGAEYVESPSAAAKALYASLADAGAALVAGSHPHLLQGCASREGALIAYSLGNFLFTGEKEPPQALKGAFLDFLIYRGRVRGLRIHPIVAGYYSTALDPDQAGAEKRLSKLCAGLEAGD